MNILTQGWWHTPLRCTSLKRNVWVPSQSAYCHINYSRFTHGWIVSIYRYQNIINVQNTLSGKSAKLKEESIAYLFIYHSKEYEIFVLIWKGVPIVSIKTNKKKYWCQKCHALSCLHYSYSSTWFFCRLRTFDFANAMLFYVTIIKVPPLLLRTSVLIYVDGWWVDGWMDW